MKPFVALALMLVLFILFACSGPAHLTVPSSTATLASSPTLQPAAGPSLNDSTSVPSATPSATTPSVPRQPISGVATDTLNVRAGPGLNYAVKGQLKQGDAVTIVGKSADGLWWQISNGWVSATYLKVSGDTTAVPVSTASQ